MLATTKMHYRIGGIAKASVSTLLLMLVERGASNWTRKFRAGSRSKYVTPATPINF